MSSDQIRMAQWPSGEDQHDTPADEIAHLLGHLEDEHEALLAAKQEIASLQTELTKCREAGMAIEHERRRQVKINQWQADVVEAARRFDSAIAEFGFVPVVVVDSYQPLHDALATLDKAQQADEAEIWNK